MAIQIEQKNDYIIHLPISKVSIPFEEVSSTGKVAEEFFKEWAEKSNTVETEDDALNYLLEFSESLCKEFDAPSDIYLPLEMSDKENIVKLIGFEHFGFRDGDVVDFSEIDDDTVALIIKKGENHQ